jgi:aspartate aminotransferase-like enzyme
MQLGASIRGLLEERGFASVAAYDFEAASVAVSFNDDDAPKNGSKFAAAGLQIAADVPLQCGEGPDYKNLRIRLFGLDKPHNIPRSVENFATALDRVIAN